MRSGTIKRRIEKLFADYHQGKTRTKKIGNQTVSHQLLQQAAQGEPAAQYRLACCYFDGMDVAQDRTTACLWFDRAATSGHVASMMRLGEAYLDGEGVDKNRIRGLFWLLKAANRGHRDACAFLGMCYTIGRGIPTSDRFAAKWHRRAANLGSVSGILGLRRCYAYGLGVGQDSVKADICFVVASTKTGQHPNLATRKMMSQGRTEEYVAEVFRSSLKIVQTGVFDL